MACLRHSVPPALPHLTSLPSLEHTRYSGAARRSDDDEHRPCTLPHVTAMVLAGRWQGEPVLVLVGMPNVGKSSIVTATSTGTPEINNYPFTTRSLKLGHVISPGSRYQLMDTPGVLRREEEERNAMEGLTLASVNLLPSVIIFVMDLSGTSGPQSAPRLQLRVREDLKAQFPHRPCSTCAPRPTCRSRRASRCRRARSRCLCTRGGGSRSCSRS